MYGAAGRVGTPVLELGAVAGLRLYGTCAARDRAAVERHGAVPIDYQTEDFLARVHELPGKGVDVVLDGLAGFSGDLQLELLASSWEGGEAGHEGATPRLGELQRRSSQT